MRYECLENEYHVGKYFLAKLLLIQSAGSGVDGIVKQTNGNDDVLNEAP